MSLFASLKRVMKRPGKVGELPKRLTPAWASPDPKRDEVWPWHDESSGALIYEDRYYGFGDSGSLAGSFDGYESAAAFLADSNGAKLYYDSDFSTNPYDLGSVSICILSGREFMDQLYHITKGSGFMDPPDSIYSYGHWSSK